MDCIRSNPQDFRMALNADRRSIRYIRTGASSRVLSACLGVKQTGCAGFGLAVTAVLASGQRRSAVGPRRAKLFVPLQRCFY